MIIVTTCGDSLSPYITIGTLMKKLKGKMKRNLNNAHHQTKAVSSIEDIYNRQTGTVRGRLTMPYPVKLLIHK